MYHKKIKYFDVQLNHQNIYLTKKQFAKLATSNADYLQDVNEHLIIERKKIKQILKKMSKFSFEEFGRLYYQSDMLHDCFELKAKELYEEGKFSTSEYYKNTKLVFENVPIKAIDDKYIERFIKSRATYPAAYLRALRHILKRADSDFHITIKSSQHTTKIPLELDELESLRNYKSLVLQDQFIIDFWMASFYAAGINFKDLVYLEKSQVSNGWINKKRKKTGVENDIPVSEPLQLILDRYESNDPIYFFGIINFKMTEYEKHIKYDSFLSAARKRLNKIAKVLGFRNKLTPYIARHTAASIWMHEGRSIIMIQRMLGHRSPKSTESYVKSMRSAVKREMSDKLANG